MEKMQEEKERAEIAIEEYSKLHKWLKNAAAEDSQDN